MAHRNQKAARKLTALALGALGLGACNAITGLGDDYVLERGDGGTTPTGDANQGLDGPIEGSTLDGGDSSTTPDADAGDGGPLLPFCQRPENTLQAAGGPALFCTDFELATGSPYGFTSVSLLNGTLAIDPTGGVNGSKGLRAKITDATGSRRAFVEKDFPQMLDSFKHYEYSFAFAVKTASTVDSALGALGINGATGYRYAGVSLYNTGSAPNVVDISDPPGGNDGTGVLAAVDQWHTATLVYDVPDGGVTPKLTVKVDGNPVALQTTAFTGTSTPIFILLGAFFTPTSAGTVDVVLDDVVFRATQ